MVLAIKSGGVNVSHAEVLATGATTERQLGDSFADVFNVKDYGAVGNDSTDDTTNLQAAIDAWTDADIGTLYFPPGRYRTTSELTITLKKNTDPRSKYGMLLSGYGALIRPDADMDYVLTITDVQTGQIPVAEKSFEGLQLFRKSGTSGGLRIDGTATAQGWMSRFVFTKIGVWDVLGNAYQLQGEFFESAFVNCVGRIPDYTEAGIYCIHIAEGIGNISSIDFYGGSFRGGQHVIKLDGADDGFKMFGGTLLQSGKELIKVSGSGTNEFGLHGVHLENAWGGSSAVASGSWNASTNQPVIDLVGSGAIIGCKFLSNRDTNTAMVRTFASDPILVSGCRGIGEFRDCVDISGSANGRITVIATQAETLGGVSANTIKERGSTPPYIAIGCHTDTESIKTLANDATPSLLGKGRLLLTGGTTTITDFDDGVFGQEIVLFSEHAITITDGTNILLHGSANFVMASGDSLTLFQKADGKWHETARMVN